MAHLGGTPPQDQLSSGSTSNTNADVANTLQLPSQPSNRRGSSEMIAGRVPVIVESAGTYYIHRTPFPLGVLMGVWGRDYVITYTLPKLFLP